MDALLAGLLLPSVENHSLAALLEAAHQAGFHGRSISFGGWEDLGAVIGAALRDRPRLFGISIQNTEAALASLALCQLLRRAGYRGRIVCGGHFATLNAEEILTSPAGVDAVVRFAGEDALVGLLRGDAPSSLPGVLYRAPDGSILSGAPPRHPGLRPTRTAALPVHLGVPAADLVASHGCEARCAYCCVAGASQLMATEGAGGYVRRSVEELGEEMSSLHHQLGARLFNFMDDNVLPLDAGEAAAWLRDLRRSLRSRGVGPIAFSLQLRADVVTEEVADELSALGLARAYVGIDGYSRAQLIQLGRRAAPQAGPLAVERLSRREIFVVCNALLLGPTISYASLCDEVEALCRVTDAPVHLLPIDARRGTAYYERAHRRGLIEGGFLWHHHRFEDPRTELVAGIMLSFPTRLHERLVPIALYDLGYNLGAAARLYPQLDLRDAAERYRAIAQAWNLDQVRLLRAACEVAAGGGRTEAEALRAREAPFVRAHDEALVRECDRLIVELERATAGLTRRSVRAHERGKILSAVAIAMGLAACRTQPLPEHDLSVVNDLGAVRSPDLAPAARPDLTVDPTACPPERQAVDDLQLCLCPYGGAIQLTFDGRGVIVSITKPDGTGLPNDVAQCLQSFFSSYCYPSLAGTTKEVMSSHCWVA